MGKENDVMVDYLREDRRFADLFNGSVFGGECVVNPEELEEAGEVYTEFKTDETAASGNRLKKKEVVSRLRDVKKRLRSGAELRILAVEEQSHIDYAMPWRCMNYDSLEYGRQVHRLQQKNKTENKYQTEDERMGRFLKGDRIAPVYTICLYHGEKPWDGPRSLQDMVDFGNDKERMAWEKAFTDYGMRLICVNELGDVSGFTTELRDLFGLMQYRGDKQGMNQFLEEHKEFRHIDKETARVIGTVMGVDVFMEDSERFREGKGYNMCTAIREMWMDGWNDGVSTGISQGISQGIREILGELGEVSASLEGKIDAQKDEKTLRKWIRLAARVKSVKEFEEKICEDI